MSATPISCFRTYYPRDTLKRRLGAAAFLPVLRALGAVSSRLAFPTAGLAEAVLGPGADAVLLPPGAPPPVDVPRSPTAHRILYVGDARLPAHGADRLISAVETARGAGVDLELDVVSRPGQDPAPPHPPWMRVHRAEGPGIHALLPDVVATAIPRPRSRYNDLALPIKLFDYLSYGRPLLVTDCTEQARVVTDADAGLVTRDDPAAMAEALVRARDGAAGPGFELVGERSGGGAGSIVGRSRPCRPERPVGFDREVSEPAAGRGFGSRIASDSFVYGLGGIANQAVAILLVPDLRPGPRGRWASGSRAS